MGIGKRIKEARSALGMTQEELAKLLGVTKGAVANYENETSHPKEPVMYKMFDALQVDANYLFQDVVNIPKKVNDVTFSEFEHIKKYRSLDDYGKELVNLVLDKESERCQNHTPAAIIELSPTNKFFPYYGKIASAGKGFEFSDIIDTDGGAEYPLTKVNRLADYTIGVSGDSMEPVYYDGDIVFVKRVYDLEYGDVGIFQKDNEILIKQVGKNELLSFNPKYPPIPDNGDIRCLGKVLGKVDENCT